MGTVPARQLIEVWSFRLSMHGNDGVKKWSPSLRRAVQELLERLHALDPEEHVGIDADEERDSIAIFFLARTGEVLGQIAGGDVGGNAYDTGEEL